MTVPQLFFHFIVICSEFLLLSYFYFTLVAIVKGGAPIPSRRSTVKRILQLAELSPGESLLDLGSGDGRILFEAAARGAKCRGVEINPFLVWYCRLKARFLRLDNVEIAQEDFWKTDLSSVDVVTVYLVPIYMAKLEEKVKREMRPGSRVVTATYPFPHLVPDIRPNAGDRGVAVYRYTLP